MHKQYEPRKDLLFGIVFFAGPLVAWIGYALSPHSAVLVLAILISGLFLWIWYGTIYQLNDKVFFFRCGPFSRSIPVSKITQIEGNVRSWAGMRPALTFTYLQIRYNQYDDVFIAPQDEEAFIRDLLRKNPAINIAVK